MAMNGGLKSAFITHPYAVTYTLAFLLTLSFIALIAVAVNCKHKPVLVDAQTGALLAPECILND